MDIIDSLILIFEELLSFWTDILQSTGMRDFWLVGVCVFLSFSFLLFPLRGSSVSSVHSGSDTVISASKLADKASNSGKRSTKGK